MKLTHEEIRTFAYLHSAADWALEQAESAEKNEMFPSMHTILASVHSIEAFTNHIGPRYFDDKWDDASAKLSSPKDKIRALLEELKIPLSDIQPEYDSYMLGLNIRKELVHGRTHEKNKTGNHIFNQGSKVSSTFPQWHRKCDPETARRIFEAVTTLLELMGEACGEGRKCWGILGHGIGWGDS